MDIRIGLWFDEHVSSRIVSCSKPKANRDRWSEVPATAQTRGARVDNDAAYMHRLPKASRALVVGLFLCSLQLSSSAPFCDLLFSWLWKPVSSQHSRKPVFLAVFGRSPLPIWTAVSLRFPLKLFPCAT